MFHRFHTGTWQRRPSGHVPTRFIPVRVARATVTMAVLRICALLLLFDCQEAFHCCLVVACINRINMISIKCHRSGERCPGKREFDNRIEINRVRSGEIMWLFPLKIATELILMMDRKSYMRFHMTPLSLTLSDLERSIQVTQVFNGLYLQIYSR